MMKLCAAGVGFSQAHLPTNPTPKHTRSYNLFSLGCCCYLPARSNCNYNYRCRAFAHSQPDSQETRIRGEETPPAVSSSSGASSSASARTQLSLLDQLTSTSPTATEDPNRKSKTIRQQLKQLIGDRDGEFSIPLGKDLKNVSAKFLTVSQKRNIRRQAYLDTVSRRNDTLFFTTIAASVAFPPLIILGIAILTGYVQLLP